jgi:APA family basic amino acid/polyamine antiporter
LGIPLKLGAVAGMTSVMLVMTIAQARIFFAMARDGLLPKRLASVSERTGSPSAVTTATAIVVSLVGGIFPLGEIAELANAGTLTAFAAVAVCMLILRVREPNRPRVFRTPLPWIVGPVAIVGCIYLFVSLPGRTQLRFAIWSVIGVLVYLAYGVRKSRVALLRSDRHHKGGA